MESEIMTQIVPAGYHIRHISCPFSPDLFLSLWLLPSLSGPRQQREEMVEDKTIPELKPRWLFQSASMKDEGYISSFVLQLKPSLQTNCFVPRLLNCKSQFKISLSVDKEGYMYICTFYCPRQNSKHHNKIDCSSLIFIWSNTFNNSAVTPKFTV